MKLHYLLVAAVAEALREVFQQGRYADKVIEKTLRSNPKWGSRDRAFIAENTYDCVRWWRLLWALMEREASFEQASLFRLIGINLSLGGMELPDWKEWSDIRGTDFGAIRAAISDRKIRESVPDWLDALGCEQLGEAAWAVELSALNEAASVVLRVNTLKTDKGSLQEILAKEGWETASTPLAPDALVMARRGNIFQTTAFQSGLFEVQDAGSQCIAPMLEVEPGMRVVDACAGAGGKTLHLAALMRNKGKIIAMDTEEWKLDALKLRAKRAGIHIIETRLIDSTKVIKRLQESADRLLLDVPCSGLGVLRRNPDAKWKLSADFLTEVNGLQDKILTDYSRMMRPYGAMVYATCSILPLENERVVGRFLEGDKGFRLSRERKVLPGRDGFDGFYVARLTMDNG